MASHKAARINLRTTRERDTLIRRAAGAHRKSVSEFVLEAACRSAESTLLDTKTILLDKQGWEQLSEELDRDAREVSELVKLFRDSVPWD